MAATMTAAKDLVSEPRFMLFIRFWGVALVAHVVGNPGQPDLPGPVGTVNLAVGLLGILLVLAPALRLLVVSSLLVVTSVVLEMPVTGNHWLVAGLVALAVLVSGAKPHRFIPAARWILLIFYSFAAFAKLNTGFFDPAVSCAIFYTNRSLASYGFSAIQATSPLSRVVIWGTVGIELAVVPLLVMRRTRYAGVLLAVALHTVISFDLSQHFYDFTAVLLALLFLFLPDQTVDRIVANAAEIPSWICRAAGLIWIAFGTPLVVAAVLPSSPLTDDILTMVPFILWIPFSLVWVVILARVRSQSHGLQWKPGIAGAMVVLLAVLNGLTPYTEVKTAHGFNMYANLVTAAGNSNHLVVTHTFPIRHGYDGPVRIVESSDAGLGLYRDMGYLVAFPQLRRYLSTRPETSLVYERGTEEYSVARAGDVAELVDPGPWWWQFFPLRALDQQSPPRCQDVFLPAL